jgi:hypothetical protein
VFCYPQSHARNGPQRRDDLHACGGGGRDPGEKTRLFEPFMYKMHLFTKTGSGQT